VIHCAKVVGYPHLSFSLLLLLSVLLSSCQSDTVRPYESSCALPGDDPGEPPFLTPLLNDNKTEERIAETPAMPITILTSSMGSSERTIFAGF
jgi:hypothetical protein